MYQLTIIILNFIYLFSFLFTFFLIYALINGLLSNLSYEDNVFNSVEDYREQDIHKIDFIYEEVFEHDIDLQDFRADEKLRGDFNDLKVYKSDLKTNNNFDDFTGYYANKNWFVFNYLELNLVAKLFFNNEGLILFFIVLIYNAINFLNAVLIFFLCFYVVLFIQYNGFFNFKKFLNVASTIKSEKGFLEYNETDLDTKNVTADLAQFVGSSDHFLLTQRTKRSLYNNTNYYPNDFSKQNLVQLINNNFESNFNYLTKFLSSTEEVNRTLNSNLLNFLIYYNVTTEWKKTVPDSTLLKFENTNEQDKVNLTYLTNYTTSPFVTFTLDVAKKRLFFLKKNNFILESVTDSKFSNSFINFLKDKRDMNFIIKAPQLVDSSIEQLKFNYSNFYNCLPDESFDTLFTAFESFLKLNDTSFYLSKVNVSYKFYINHDTFRLNFLRKNYIFTDNYVFKDIYQSLYHLNFFKQAPVELYTNKYFSVQHVVNLRLNLVAELSNKNLNVILLENFLTIYNEDKLLVNKIWNSILTNLPKLVKIIQRNSLYVQELKQIVDAPFNNKFYLHLVSNKDYVKLSIYNFLFSAQLENFTTLSLGNVDINLTPLLNKNKFLKQTFKKFFKFDITLKLKQKKLNKRYLSRKKFFYFFWITLTAELKKQFGTLKNKVTLFRYMLLNKDFLNFFRLNLKLKQVDKLNVMLMIFLSPFENIFYKFLTAENFNFYVTKILNNPAYTRLKLNYLNFSSWVNFFNSVPVNKLILFFNLKPNKLLSVKNFINTSSSSELNYKFLSFNTSTAVVNFSKLFFLKNLYKKLFFENNYFKFDEASNLAEYFLYLRKIFFLIFKFELNNVLDSLLFNNLLNGKPTYTFKQNKKLVLIKKYILLKRQKEKSIVIPKNDYTASLLELLLTENNFMFHNYYNAITNYYIYSDSNYKILNRTVPVTLLKKLNIFAPNLNYSSGKISLLNLVSNISFVDFVTILNYCSNLPKIKLTADDFYSDNILNPNSVSNVSFIWVDNEEDIFSEITEDIILLEDNAIDNDADEDYYPDLGLIDYSAELNSDLFDTTFKKSLTKDYGYVSFFPYKSKQFTERFLFFNYFKEFITYKNSKIYLNYHPNWITLIFNFFKIIIIVLFRNIFSFINYKFFLLFLVAALLYFF